MGVGEEMGVDTTCAKSVEEAGVCSVVLTM